MIQAIIQGIFGIITMLANAIISPLIAVVTALYPNIGYALEQLSIFLIKIVTFIPLACQLLMIPRDAITFLFDYYLIKYSIYIATRAVKAAIKMYNKLKL